MKQQLALAGDLVHKLEWNFIFSLEWVRPDKVDSMLARKVLNLKSKHASAMW